jgi:ppGpp synthetase/RelA/SpoT-type nucleotidyltranferase
LKNKFLLLSRLFTRLKSADSILEKIRRKNLTVHSVSEIGQVMDDLLGLRIITEDLEELWAFDKFLTNSFEVRTRLDKIDPPGQFGYRSIEYGLIYRDGGMEIPFEVQLRTFLQHYWAMSSFFLFHKASPDKAQAHEEVLCSLSKFLAEAEQYASQLLSQRERPLSKSKSKPAIDRLPLHSLINLMVIKPGEQFARHEKISMSGDNLQDHHSIVERKVSLYEQYPEAAIVECSCMNFATFALNEPHVVILPESIEQITW